MGELTIAGLQRYLKEKDFNPGHKMDYFLKLTEEVGELARAIWENATPVGEVPFKGSVEEELCDVLYYTLALANVYEVDLEKWIPEKEQLNDKKYGTDHAGKLAALSPAGR